MSNIYLTSDWHFNHNREFIYKPRGFETVEEMNAAIIERHNSMVAPDDDVYVLGDLCLGGGGAEVLAENKALIERMNGRLHIILGNHDTPARIAMYETCANVVDVKYADLIHYKGYHLFLTHFPCMTANYDKDTSLKAKILNICGHKHTVNCFDDMNNNIIYHVEMDAHNCYPISFDNIIIDIKHFGQK